ncbi:Bug family tripartite tricarboxylate transporter substrate binding protein [Variovorax sp. LT1R16]|uniref:Bug family tripartite tricarboxylate transporter substrate binding protein n=1 Tax=Variovorax sp. LT1R16 TaxID=3443728 RepID=UPI003F44DEB3
MPILASVRSPRTLLAFSLALGGLLATGAAQATDYPVRPIELVVPYQAGGGADVMARGFAAAAVKHLPQPIVVVNKPGAAGVIGWNDVINAKPDGYRLALTTVEVTFLNQIGLAKFGWNDLTPIARLNADPAVVVVRADAPWTTLEQFVAAAKKPDANVRVGNAGQGSMWHLAAAALADRTGASFNYIPYAGGAPAVLALLGGHVDAVTVSTPEVAAHIGAGKLRALGVMADRRVKGFESVPTLKERGIDLELGTWRGLAVPKGTPPEVIAVLKAATAKTMKEPSLRADMERLNFTVDTDLDSAAFEARMAQESAYIKDILSRVVLLQK